MELCSVASFYWSTTTHVTLPDRAWLLGFDLGFVGYDNKFNVDYVRAVRTGS